MFNIPEVNVIKKNWRQVELRIALCYPNVYRAGMSGLTIQLLYALFNSREDVVCERFFLPTENEPLLSLESNQPLNRFNVLAFSFQYEEDYLKALQMLLNSGVELDRKRRAGRPIIIAGGPCITENPEPLRDFFDIFIIGEVEPILDDLINEIKVSVEKREVENFKGRRGFLTPEDETVHRIWLKNLDDGPHPIAQVIPKVEPNSPYQPIFGDVFTVEVVRGCARRCKFCLMGAIGRPIRERSLANVKEIIDEGLKHTPTTKVSLIGAGISDYSKLEEVCEYIIDRELEISIPSLSVNRINENLIRLLVKGKQRTISIAPETGSQELRKQIYKNIKNEQILDAAKIAYKEGVKNLKMYFIIGLPDETEEDVKAIAKLSKQVASTGFGRRAVRVSINPLIPKPHTSFQFLDFKSSSYLKTSFKKIEKELHGDARFRIEILDINHAKFQAALSRGDRKLGTALSKAARYGGGMGGLRRALKEEKLSLESYLSDLKPTGSFPWSNIYV
ncbi:MAG: radical SAM protein [Candidatus Bathyarchaeota archaeon]